MARRFRLYRKILVFFLLLIAVIAMAKTEKRVALIWGNAEYDGWDNLPQCTHDADTIADRLWKLGFDTLMLKNGNKSEMESSLYRFQERIKGADVAVFFILVMLLMMVVIIWSRQKQNLTKEIDSHPTILAQMRYFA